MSDSHPSAVALQLSSEEFKKAFPKQYLSLFLQSGIRTDGRELTVIRPETVHAGVIQNADSSSTVQRGGTVVTCAVKLEVGKPSMHKPNEGRIEINTVMSPLAFPGAEFGENKEALVLNRCLSSIIIGSGVISLNQLSISPEYVWVVYIDLAFLSYDGNKLDVSLEAVFAALEKLRLPTVDFEDSIPVITDGPSVPLTIFHKPKALTFGFFEKHMLIDPSVEEEELLQSKITIAGTILHKEFKVCGVFKDGGKSVSKQDFTKMYSIISSFIATN